MHAHYTNTHTCTLHIHTHTTHIHTHMHTHTHAHYTNTHTCMHTAHTHTHTLTFLSNYRRSSWFANIFHYKKNFSQHFFRYRVTTWWNSLPSSSFDDIYVAISLHAFCNSLATSNRNLLHGLYLV